MKKIIAQHVYFRILYYQEHKGHYFNWGSGLLFWLFLGITMPFGIYNHSFHSHISLLLHLIPISLLWPLWSMVIDFLVRKINPKWNDENGKNILIWGLKILLIIHSIFLYRGISCAWLCINSREYLEIWLACLIVFGLTYIFYILIAKNIYNRQAVNSATSFKQILDN